MLKSQFPKLEGEVVPLLLKTQIYSMVKDRTEVDRTLNTLRQKYVCPQNSKAVSAKMACIAYHLTAAAPRLQHN